MEFEEFIKVNNKLLWSIVENKNRMYFSVGFHKLMLTYFDKDDLYQELLTKLHKTFYTFDDKREVKQSTYITTLCKNHLMYLMQPYKTIRVKKNIDLSTLVDKKDYETMYVNKLTVREIVSQARKDKNKDILLSILKGNSQTDVANNNQLSRQRVSQIWLEFIKKVKEM